MTPEPAPRQHARVLPMRDRATADDFTRVPPNDVDAEQAVVGALMLAPKVLAEVGAVMDPADHYRPAHETIHRAILDMHAQHLPIDWVTVGDHLDKGGELHKVGGKPYLLTLTQAVPTAANAEYYAEIVHGLAQRRRSIEAGTRLVQAGMTPDATPEDLREALALSAESLPGTWSEPIPLTTQPKLPPFPSHVLPVWLRQFVDAVAEETQTPVDLAGALSLAVLATAAGGRVVVQLRGRWREPTNLFTVVALPPGNRKSAVFTAMTAPLRAVEKVLASEAAGRIAEAEVTAKMAREAADKATTQAAKAEGMERDALQAEAIALAQAADSLEIPASPRLLADDATPEVVTTLMHEQGGRLSVMSAEGGIFDIIAGRYSGTPNMEVFLKGHAGDAHRVDRRGRDEYMESPALTVGLTPQPSVLKEIGQNHTFAGRGLLARFLYALPESLVGYRKAEPDPVPEHVAESYERNVTALTLSLADWTDPAVLRLTPEADKALSAYSQRIEPQLRARGGRLGHITEWASKLVGATARIAGLLHLGQHLKEGYTQPISGGSVNAAMEIGDYFAAHALTVFDLMGADATLARARSLLTVLQDNGWETVTRRDLFAKVSRSEFPTVADLEPTMALLEEHGYLRTETPPRTGKRGRPPAPRYVIHPQLREAQA